MTGTRNRFRRVLLAATVLTIACVNAHAAGDTGDAALNEKGMESLRAGELAQAESLFCEAIKMNPGVKYYYNNAAVAQMKQKCYDKAYESLRRAVELDAAYAKALSNLSITCFYLSRFREAFGYYLRAREADRAYVDERFERSRVRRKVEEISRENPENGDYKKILERLDSAGDTSYTP